MNHFYSASFCDPNHVWFWEGLLDRNGWYPKAYNERDGWKPKIRIPGYSHRYRQESLLSQAHAEEQFLPFSLMVKLCARFSIGSFPLGMLLFLCGQV